MNCKQNGKMIVLICTVLILSLVCLASCEQNVNNALETGSLSVSFSGSGAKNITPSVADTTVATYEVAGVLSTDSTQTFTRTGLIAKAVTVEDLLVGTWNIVAKGYNAAGTLIAQSSSTSAVITKDQNTAVTLALNYLTSGTGSLTYSIKWSKNIDQIKGFTIEIEGRSPITLSIAEASLTGNIYELTGSQNSIATGQYDVVAKALDSNNNLIGYNIEERLDIYKDLTSVYDLTLNEGLYPPNTPAFSVEPGEVALNTEVEIRTQTEGAEIYYTTDGTDPATSETKILYSTPISISENKTIKAVAVLNNRLSKVATGTYTLPAQIKITDPFMLNDLEIVKTDLKIRTDMLSLESPTSKEIADVSWKINGVEKTETATLEKGSNLVMAKTTIKGREYIESKVISVTSEAEVKLTSKLNERSKTGLEMVTVLSEKTQISGSGMAGAFIEDRSVTLSPYVIGKYEVTQDLFNQVMGFNPSTCKDSPTAGETQGLRPVEKVTWYDAVAFCNKLTKMAFGEETTQCVYSIENIAKTNIDYPNSITSATVTQDLTKKGYRLPTEAEWECAARGGNPSASAWNYTYSGSNDNIGTVAWCDSNSLSKSHEVGKKTANLLGLYDMSGNVWEWCWDWYGDIATGNVENPMGANNGSSRVLRGGSWYSRGSSTTVYNRIYISANGRGGDVGLRVCRSL